MTDMQPTWQTSDGSIRLYLGDCLDVLPTLAESSIDAIVTDPPYGLEFMGKDWDRIGDARQPGDENYTGGPGPYGRSKVRYGNSPSYGGWQGGGGFSKHGIGERETPWASFGSTSRFGTANPTCSVCGGRLRGKKKCTCEQPHDHWKPIGKRRDPANEGLPNDMTGGGYASAAFRMQQWHYAWAVEALRVLKPGGHLLAFGGSRTYHRLACAVEDAGFEVRDCIMWLYGSGFPKSLDVSKAIDKAAGIDREDKFEGSFDRQCGPTGNRKCETCGKWLVSGSPCQCPRPQDRAVTEAAQAWEGWGTALKPAHEPIIVARKPLSGTVAANVQAHGTGGLNIDACRIELNGDYKCKANGRPSQTGLGDNYDPGSANQPDTVGRWPANVIADEAAGAMIDEQTGTLTSGTGAVKRATGTGYQANAYGKESRPPGTPNIEYGDAGGASRFFYCPKADQDQRAGSKHPTIKPLDLMGYLVRLVTPPGGLLLDLFMGSGTTIEAAYRGNWNAIGIERDADYFPDCVARIRAGVKRHALFESV